MPPPRKVLTCKSVGEDQSVGALATATGMLPGRSRCGVVEGVLGLCCEPWTQADGATSD
ncbi:hypothetical protein [Thermoleptolyngbya sp.]